MGEIRRCRGRVVLPARHSSRCGGWPLSPTRSSLVRLKTVPRGHNGARNLNEEQEEATTNTSRGSDAAETARVGAVAQFGNQ